MKVEFVRNLIETGVVQDDTLVWTKGMVDWVSPERERERGLLFRWRDGRIADPPHSASTLPLASRRPGLQELISNVPIFMTPLEKDLKEYYTPGKPNRDKEVAQMKEVSESKGKDSRRMKSRREIPSLTPKISPLPLLHCEPLPPLQQQQQQQKVRGRLVLRGRAEGDARPHLQGGPRGGREGGRGVGD